MKTLKNRFLFTIYYYLLWICYFIFARVFFLAFYFKKTQELSFLTTLKTFLYGLKLDSSFTAYLCFIPFLLMIFTVFVSPKKIGAIIKWYSYIIIAIISFFLLMDLGLYEAWGIRLDATFFKYLNTPEVMIASASTFQIIFGIVFWLLISFVFIRWFRKVINKKIATVSKGNWLQAPIFLLLTAALIIPVRGGLQTIPVNQSNVYFSDSIFANHAAINFIWNFSNALTHKISGKNPYIFFDKKVAKNIISERKNQLLKANTDSILNTTKPNIILIVWESLTAKVVGAVGGEPHVTENLNRLSKEGILFTNFYANGDRTDKGIPAILSGYYPQPTESIMKMPNKTRSLPMLPQKLINLGYKTTFYYGGDLNFGNMNTYLRNAGIRHFVDGDNFDKKDWNSKWGAYDDVFMKRLAKDLHGKQKEPFFKIALTLSSHEPYEIKGDYKFGKDTEVNKFRSAHAYTDSSVGAFIEDAKKQPWYKNTLIIILGDHGHHFPKHTGAFNSPKKFRIPMVWLGGALRKTGIKIDNIASQVDIPFTLLSLLKEDNSNFTFSKNIFNTSEKQYAHYIFNKGFGTVSKNGVFVYDFMNNKPILKTGKEVTELESLGKAITQDAFQDFLDR
ncbi:MAG: LTA synthase family protein [Polaribacter sp.]